MKTTEALRLGIRRSITLDGVDLDAAILYSPEESCWLLRARIRVAQPSEYIPTESNWICLVDLTYPRGSVRMFPAKDGGIISTFPHQELNLPGPSSTLWRTGKLCLDRPVDRLGSVAGRADPVGDADERLRWHLLRAREWIRLAATDCLIANGDPFEVPWCPARISGPRRVHEETAGSYHAWKELGNGHWGVVVWEELASFRNTRCAVVFEDRRGTPIRATRLYSAERHGRQHLGRDVGYWWLWPRPIVVPPWQCPTTWGELRIAGKTQGIDVDGVLRQISRRTRGTDGGTLLLGYSIPLHWGESACEVHWQAVSLPRLKLGGKPDPGFRANELGWWMRDRREAFSGDGPISYLGTENWSSERLLARGRLDSSLRSARIGLIGCGALGSAVAEILVRGGVSNMVLVDDDHLSAGNLVRHTLTGADIGRKKAEALAERLRAILPMATIEIHPGRLPLDRGELEGLLDNIAVVLDCTAADEIPLSLSEAWWGTPRLFASASTGYMARRTFLYLCFGNTFDNETFVTELGPWLQDERKAWALRGETLEGAGCWSPLFPARFDDVLMAAAACVKAIENRMADPARPAELIVYEEKFDEGGFVGFRRLPETETDMKLTSPDSAI